MKIIKRVIFVFAISAILGCRHETSHIFIPKEYEYPISKINKGVKFVYYNIDNASDSLYEESYLSNINHEQVIISKRYANGSMISLDVTDTNSKLIELINYIYPKEIKPAKAQIIKDEVSMGPDKLARKELQLKFEDGNVILLRHFKSEILKDTTISYLSKILPAVVILSNEESQMIYKGVKRPVRNIITYSYYLYGVGLYRFIFIYNDKITTVQLKGIKPLEK